MRILLLTCLCLSLLANYSHAQRRTHRISDIQREEWTAEQDRRELHRLALELKKIAVHWQKNTRGEYEFICDNRTFSDYTIEVNFSEFTNLQSEFPLPALIEAAPGTHPLFVLKKATGGMPVHFQYHYRSFKGRPSPKIDTGFAYLLPVAPGAETRIYELYNVGNHISGDSKPKDWYALSLHTEAGDTVYAARRGRVTAVRDHADLQDSNYAYSSAENFVEIEHNDYSFGKYEVFRDNSIFVHPGEIVEAGQPIGISGGDKYAGGPQVRFCVFYQQRQDVLDKDGNNTGRTQNWAYVPIYFWTKDQGKVRLTNKTSYTSEYPEEVITKEMTKKEAKRWKETHKNA